MRVLHGGSSCAKVLQSEVLKDFHFDWEYRTWVGGKGAASFDKRLKVEKGTM